MTESQEPSAKSKNPGITPSWIKMPLLSILLTLVRFFPVSTLSYPDATAQGFQVDQKSQTHANPEVVSYFIH